MNYTNAELIERLAAEYVLGTLRGAARARFERVLMESYMARQAVWSWETQISPLGTMLPEVKPPPGSFAAIRRRLFGHSAAPTTRRWRDGMWKGWSLAATTVALMLAAVLVFERPDEAVPDRVALVADEAAEPRWLISIDLDSGRLEAKALNVEAVAAGRAFELWLLPGADRPPRSLGLLPVAGGSLDEQLAPALIELLGGADGLAVSLEPAGGSPTGLPTGPVLYQSKLLAL